MGKLLQELSLRQKATNGLRRLASRVRADIWFPHLPLATLIALLGLTNVITGLEKLAPQVPGIVQMVTLRKHFVLPHGLLTALAGLLVLIMSLGLALRSRLAWAISLLLIAGTLALSIHQHWIHFSSMVYFNAAILLSLIIFFRSFSKSSLAAGTLLSGVSLLLLIGYAMIGTYMLGNDFNPPIKTWTNTLYFVVVTLSTVGYGDITPRTNDAKLFVVSLIILGITVFATSISTVIVPLIGSRMERLLAGEKKRMRKDHYIVVGENPLAQNTYRQLRDRKFDVTVILPNPPTAKWVEDSDLIIGDPTDSDVLRKAGAQYARAVLALRNDDSENAFIVMAAKDIGGDAKTVAAVKNANNLQRVKRVAPDLIVAPDILGGELLAMALSGEKVDGNSILNSLFITKAP
ncbi:MAG: voltage-gated potassium channel protein [Phycisphaerae bacterium]